MGDIYRDTAELLAVVEGELKALLLWEEQPPAPEALASTEPFCVDTIEFNQWLQFVFLPRIYDMIDRRQPLPRRCGIAPMAEEYLRVRSQSGTALVAVLGRLDRRLSQQ